MNGPSVSLVLLRGLLPDVPLRPGSFVIGRVLDPTTLLLEGVKMQAKLPHGVEPGQRLRLRVEQADTDRLHLRIVDTLPEQQELQDAQQVQQPSAQAYALALPGGIEARLYVTEDGDDPETGGSAPERPVVLRWDSPALGRLDIRLDRLSAAIHASAGDPANAVRGAMTELKDALERTRGHEVQVTLHPRLETFDAQA